MARKLTITKLGASTIVKFAAQSGETESVVSYNGNHTIQTVGDNIVIDSLQLSFSLDQLEPPFVGTPEEFINSLAEDLKFTDAVSV